MQLRFTLRLDSEKTDKMSSYYLYRSEEFQGDRPVVDGVYLQWNAVGSIPPEKMSIVLEWT